MQKQDLELPRLYKKSKTGVVVICDIKTLGDKIVVTTGQIEGKKINHETTCAPKNTGKKNATTADEQARLEAQAKHKKKIKSGYVLDASGEITRKLPMLVKKYQDQKKNITFPCYGSPKLNGINGLYRQPDQDVLELYSRGGDQFPEIPHLNKEIHRAMKLLNSSEINGELYIPGEHLQDIQSAVTKPNELSPRLELHLFEIADSSAEYKDKVHALEAASKEMDNQMVFIVPIKELNSHEEIEEYLHECLKDNYEGIVIRNRGCVYEYNTRSSNAFKYKLPEDAEFKITSYRLDKKGHPVFTCICGKNNEHSFAVKPKGTDAERKRVAENADDWVGKWLKVEFETYSKDLKPLKPVGIGLRKCGPDGKPQE